jgi:hypothetical protein
VDVPESHHLRIGMDQVRRDLPPGDAAEKALSHVHESSFCES